MKTKRCWKCRQVKPLSKFPRDRNRKGGLKPCCKACNSAMVQKWKRDNKDRYKAYKVRAGKERVRLYLEYKSGLVCQECGVTEEMLRQDYKGYAAILQFHHRSPDEKEFSVGQGVSRRPISRLMKEIAKCNVLCLNCHIKLHHPTWQLKKPIKKWVRIW